MESLSPRPDPGASQVALRIIAHIRTAAWGIVDVRRAVARTGAASQALTDTVETLLDVLADAEKEAVHAYRHAELGQCPQGSTATSIRKTLPDDDPSASEFRMAGRGPVPNPSPFPPGFRRHAAD